MNKQDFLEKLWAQTMVLADKIHALEGQVPSPTRVYTDADDLEIDRYFLLGKQETLFEVILAAKELEVK